MQLGRITIEGFTNLVGLFSWTYGPIAAAGPHHRAFRPTNGLIQGEDFAIFYGGNDHSALGLVTTETVKIGSLTVPDVPVGLPTAVRVFFAGFGIVWLGFKNN